MLGEGLRGQHMRPVEKLRHIATWLGSSLAHMVEKGEERHQIRVLSGKVLLLSHQPGAPSRTVLTVACLKACLPLSLASAGCCHRLGLQPTREQQAMRGRLETDGDGQRQSLVWQPSICPPQDTPWRAPRLQHTPSNTLTRWNRD